MISQQTMNLRMDERRLFKKVHTNITNRQFQLHLSVFYASTTHIDWRGGEEREKVNSILRYSICVFCATFFYICTFQLCLSIQYIACFNPFEVYLFIILNISQIMNFACSCPPSQSSSCQCASLALLPVIKLLIFQTNQMTYLEQTQDDQVSHATSYYAHNLKNMLKLKQPFYIYQHRERARSKIIFGQMDTPTHSSKVQAEGYNILAKVVQYYHTSEKPTFDLIASPPNLPMSLEKLHECTYVSLRPFTFNLMILKTQDIIKFGQEIFKVTIVDEYLEQNHAQPHFQWCSQTKVQPKLEGVCRICLSEELERGDHLISPCRCSGSCGVTHLSCLKAWLSIRTGTSVSPKVISFTLKALKCQICKSNFPRYLQINNQTVDLLALTMAKSYVLLEKISEPKEEAFIIPFTEGRAVDVSIGQSVACDIFLNQGSISKQHATLHIFGGGGIGLSDNGSACGTQVLLRRDIYNLKKVSIRNRCYLYTFLVQKDGDQGH